MSLKNVFVPLLLMIYTMDQFLISSEEIRVHRFAHDNRLYEMNDKQTSKDELPLALQRSFRRMRLWASHFGIPIGIDKCTVMHIPKVFDAESTSAFKRQLRRWAFCR